MAKFKKITTKYLCMLSAVVMFVSALFYPLESFRADSLSAGNLANVNFHVSIHESELSADLSNVSVPPSYSYDGHGHDIYFKWFGNRVRIFNSSSDVFAYRITILSSNVSGSNSLINCISSNFVFGSIDDFANNTVLYVKNTNNGESSGWYISNFASAIPMYFGVMFDLWQSHTPTIVSLPSIDYEADIVFYFQPYTVQDLSDEIYAVLQNIYSSNQSMLSKLEQIYTSVDTVETKLQSLVSIAEQIENNTDELEGLLKTCNSYLASIKTELEEQTTWLERIWNTLVDYFDTSNSQQDKVDDFANNSNQQSGSLDNLVNDMGQLEKPSVDGSADYIDEIIPSGDGFIFGALRTLRDLEVVGDMLLLTVTMAFVAYVLFGKR